MALPSWSVQDAKNRFSEVVEAARRKPQTVTKHGKAAVVIVAADEYERLRKLQHLKAPSFAELLLAMPTDGEEFERLDGRMREFAILIFLLDTVVLSELRKPPRQRNRLVEPLRRAQYLGRPAVLRGSRRAVRPTKSFLHLTAFTH